MAGGPVGIIIIVNHKIGSAESQDVRAASRYMNEIEMLSSISLRPEIDVDYWICHGQQ